MKRSNLAALAASLAIAIVGTAAHAATLINFQGPTAEMESPGFIEFTLNAVAGLTLADFTIEAFGSLDGIVANNLEDDFLLSENGAGILNGTWDLGGGGQDFVSFQPITATIEAHSNGFNRGGLLHITAPLILNAGVNKIRFAYSSAVPQGLVDEGWALRDFTLTGAAGVPEPAAWALMLAGAFGAGASLRRAGRPAPPRIA